MPWTPVTMPERTRMRSLRKQGLPLEEIAALVGRTAPCVALHTRDLGIECKRGTKGLGADGYARLLKAAEDGVSRAELAARFGLKQSSISPTLSRLRRARRQTAQEARAC
ncbi:hypothetical protein E8E01_15000 [Methylorubrum populi]|uniref:hypothetical protein n=1 Tax=Methylorubrum populi TaxID=223967 RepID=UPI00115465F1|nr:hypothetical protein [Methylorubrum populi]QDI81658.1 hypothetical protein E8E01_15000 [Methylorubrum populi]